MRAMKNIVILISGRGSNMEAMLHAAAAEKWPARIAAVISNKADAIGLQTAEAAGIPTSALEHRNFPDRESFDRTLAETIDRFKPDLLVLAGFMRILTAGFVHHYQGRLLNIHPSLLPSFPGLATHQQAIDAGVKFHGATVHYVTPELDHGPIVDQAVVPVLDGDTEAELAKRVLAQEHVIYPRAVRDIIEGRVWLDGDRVRRVASTAH
jgi:phosphoribosylglycinamide formyltransferase-1